VISSPSAARPSRWWPTGLAWALWALALLCLAATAWLDGLLRQGGLPELVWLDSGSQSSVLATLVAATVGALVAGRRPAHPVGWLLLAMGLSLSASGVVSGYRWLGLVGRPGSLPGAAYVAGLANGINIAFLVCTCFVLLLTPTGTLPSPRWRWWARAAAGAAAVFVLESVVDPVPLYPEYPDMGNPIGVQAFGRPPLELVAPVSGLVVLAALLAGAWSLVGRFRRARGAERLQLRWLAWGAVLAAMALLVALTELFLHGETAVFQAAVGVCLAVLPLATGAAILRYRLYDLDRIISRTLAYGLLTVLLALGYASVALGLGRLLGRDSSLSVAAATLGVAVGFQPARRRVQAAVDRRFNRRRHDAALVIDGFRARLRDQLDLDALKGELLAVVDQTMQPTQTSLWLRPQHRPETTG
jgi:hypothetical protein